MKQMLVLLTLIANASWAGPAPEPVAKQFLKYAYGADGISIQEICHPHDDVWMLRGAHNPEGIKAVDSERIAIKDTGILARVIGGDLCVVEMRQGKVDPSFNLDMVYGVHRQLILQFLYASLAQDRRLIARLVTQPDNVSFGKAPAAPPGDMDVYAGVLSNFPVVRSSPPSSDRVSKTITYRLPLTAQGFALRLVREGNMWKIDTDKKIEVPLAFFYQ